MNSTLRKLIEKAETIGWQVEGSTGGQHISLVHANGERYFTSATPSDWRSVQNALSDLERLGGQRLARVNHRRSRKANRFAADPQVEAARAKHAEMHGERLEREAAERAQQAAAEKDRRTAALKAAESERRERDIASLMRPGGY